MSLFKVCTFWTAQCSDYQSHYDAQLLHCCRFGFDKSEKDYIVVGSHSGLLSVFKPNAIGDPDESFTGFAPTDQLLEIKLSNPIIQLSSGKFNMGQNENGVQQLVVLHPMKLTVYSLERTDGLAEHGNQFKLNLCFEHKFNKLAFALCHGYFGGYKAREFFCITHMDCTLSLFEQDGIYYETKLDGERHIPSKMIYNARTDSFLMVSSFCDLECYRYQDLSQLVDSTVKSISPAWSLCVGEYPLDIQIQQISESECVIIVLCENIFYGITDQGNVKFMKRLDYSPICFSSFVSGWYYEPDAKLMITVISESGSILIYNLANLIWAAQLADVPVAIIRSNLDSLAGAIVTLSENGKIDVSYLGAEPQLFQVPPLNLQKMNVEKTQSELIDLEKEIKLGIDFTDPTVINASTERDLNVQFDIATALEPSKFQMQSTNSFSPAFEDVKMVLISLSLHARCHLDQIQVQFHVEMPLKCSRMICSFQSMDAETDEHADTWIYMDSDVDPVSISVSAIVSFINKQSIPRIIEKQQQLPISMFYRLNQPQKDATIKFTISIEKSVAPSIEQLFGSDFSLDPNSHGAIGLRLIYTGHIITLVVAKNSNRYRLQSDHLSALAAILEVFIHRLKNFNTYQGSKMKVIAVPQLPNQCLMYLIENHFTTQTDLQDIREKLKQSTTRMRMLERRFFTTLDNKKSDSIESVLALLTVTHQQIITQTQKMEKTKKTLCRAQVMLSAGLTVFSHIIKLFAVPQNITENMCAALVNSVIDCKMQNWEEMTTPAFDALSRVGPLRKNKHLSMDDISTVDIIPFDFERFKRHLNGILERLCRFVSSENRSGAIDTDDSLQNILYVDDTLEEEEDDATNVANEDIESLPNKVEEESDWICDVKQTMDLLPRL